MKYLHITSGLLLAMVFLLGSCKEETLILPEQIQEDMDSLGLRRPIKPDYLTFTLDYDEKVSIGFERVDTLKNRKIILTYPGETSSDSIVVSDFSSPIEITTIPVGVRTEITARAEGKNGVLSNPYSYEVQPKPFPSGAVFHTLNLVAGQGEVTVLWENPTQIPVNVKVELDGQTYQSGMNKRTSWSMRMEKPSGLYELSVYVVDSLSQQSAVRDTTLRIVSEVEIDRSDWIASASSFYEGEGPGTPQAVLDGDLNTKWHSSYWPEDLPFPHWLQFDMRQPYIVSKIQLAPRNDANDSGFLTFSLQGSLDGEQWFTLHDSGTHDPSVKALQSTTVNQPREARFLRLNMLTGGANSTHLSEFVAFTIE